MRPVQQPRNQHVSTRLTANKKPPVWKTPTQAALSSGLVAVTQTRVQVRRTAPCVRVRGARSGPCGHSWLPCVHGSRGGPCGRGSKVESAFHRGSPLVRSKAWSRNRAPYVSYRSQSFRHPPDRCQRAERSRLPTNGSCQVRLSSDRLARRRGMFVSMLATDYLPISVALRAEDVGIATLSDPGTTVGSLFPS